MLKSQKLLLRGLILIVVLLTGSSFASSEDADDLRRMLHEFLAGVTAAETHDRFWADDLIYTSSSGMRTTKADIMAGFDSAESRDAEMPGPVFTAEDIQIQEYGDTAVVAFRLVGTPPTGSVTGIQQYLNTGTFVKRAGQWQAVAWQATLIPPDDGN